MDWSYIAGFFDGEGNLHINFVKNKSYLQLMCRIYSSDRLILEIIKAFIDGKGNIYRDKNGVYELTISKKTDVLFFLNNIFSHLILKKDAVNYVLKNYNFERGRNDDFDIQKFRSFVKRKNVNKFYKNHSLDNLLTE